MHIENQLLVGDDPIDFQKARWTGGEITPEIVVLHDTAGRLEFGNSARYLAENDRKVSVHFVIERNGAIVQQVPINHRANHAGRSHYHGRDNVNGFSIGIEIVNCGRMTSFGTDQAQAWFGKAFDLAEYGIQSLTTPEHGSGLWMPYTEEQIDAVLMLLKALFVGCDTLTDITTHWYVSPGRKVDTNPLFPLGHIRSMIFGREDPLDDDVESSSADVTDENWVRIVAPSDTLNIRRWPSFNPNVIATIPDNVTVPVLRQTTIKNCTWLKVLYGGTEGWIVAGYTMKVKGDFP